MQASYRISLIPRVTEVDPGKEVEIEIFVSGYERITKNKLRIFYSPTLVDTSNPGIIESCISTARDSRTGAFLQPVSGTKYLQTHHLTVDGVYIVLEEGNFADNPNVKNVSSLGYPPIMSEYKWDAHPPLLLKINTSEKTPPGDYEITMILTYSDSTTIYTEKTSINIHIKNPIERHQWKIVILGVIIALTSPGWGEILSHWVKEFIIPLIFN